MHRITPYLVTFIALTFVDGVLCTRGDATWYYVSAGYTACGTRHSDNEMVAAIGFPYFTTGNPNNDPRCRQRIRVTDRASGRSIVVAVKDKCPSCGHNNVDFSLGAFQRLRHRDVGRFQVEWTFV